MTDLTRYLDQRLKLGTTAWERVESVVRGMERRERVAHWLDAERELADWPTPDDDDDADSVGETRDHVERLLKERMATLNEIGERPDLRTASLDERPPRYCPVNPDRTVPEKTVVWVGNGYEEDRRPWSERPTSAISPSHAFDSTDPTTNAVATDGGTDTENPDT